MGFFIFIQYLKDTSVSNSGEPDQTLHFALVASDLVLHYLRMSHKKDARLIWVKEVCYKWTKQDMEGDKLIQC